MLKKRKIQLYQCILKKRAILGVKKIEKEEDNNPNVPLFNDTKENMFPSNGTSNEIVQTKLLFSSQLSQNVHDKKNASLVDNLLKSCNTNSSIGVKSQHESSQSLVLSQPLSLPSTNHLSKSPNLNKKLGTNSLTKNNILINTNSKPFNGTLFFASQPTSQIIDCTPANQAIVPQGLSQQAAILKILES